MEQPGAGAGQREPLSSERGCSSTVNARVGLLGNPSDGCGGGAVAFSITNFACTVSLEPSASICFVPHPKHDRSAFDGLTQLEEHVGSKGLYGSNRLLTVRAVTLEQEGQALSDARCVRLRVHRLLTPRVFSRRPRA